MDNDIPSKTRKKKEDKELQQLGAQLAALSREQTDQLDLPDELHEALSLARKTTSHGAGRRQIKYVGTLLRQLDTAPIKQTLDSIRRGTHLKNLEFKRIESWRNALVRGETGLVDEITAAFPVADAQRLILLAEGARKETAAGKGKSASRALFRYLREITGS